MSALAGLTSAEAASRLVRYGQNTIVEHGATGPVRLLGRQFSSPLVLILVAGALVSLVVREWLDAAIVLVIVLGSALLGVWQESRASRAVAALRERLALTARVLRDGVLRTVPAREIVPGDVVSLSAGNLIPADGHLLDAADFLVSEASLTGEPFPVEKAGGEAVFAGTSVRSGAARFIVEATGRSTRHGAIGARLAQPHAETEFARGARQFGYLLLRIAFAVVLCVLAVNQFLGRPALESLLFAVALAVGLTPELLPAVVGVMLSHGARAMAARGVIVRRLDAIEDLGGMAVLCTDKTGTLTVGSMVLSAAVDAEGRPSPEGLRLAYLNAAFQTGIENPLDAAIVAAGEERGVDSAGHRKVDEIPYDFTRKRLTVVVAAEAAAAEHLMITKGAFASVLGICTLDAQARERLAVWHRGRAESGFRVLALAVRRTAAKNRYGRDDERDMMLVGFLLFLDPPKPDAAPAVRALADLAVRVKMVTGDERYVAAHIAAAIGLNTSEILTGREIAALNDEALWHRAERACVFAEVEPQQKERIVRALQRRGYAVGYLGDGINDAPALYAADVGISVEGAVDVARESADVVLLTRDLDVLRRGVEEGRRTFANTLKYIAITTSSTFGNMISMALATPLLPFLPLSATQILLNNFLADVPFVAIAGDKVEARKIERVQRWDVGQIRRFMLVFGLLSTAFDLLAFFVLLKVYAADRALFQTAWFVLSLLTELAVILALRTEGPAWHSVPSRVLLSTTAAVGALAIVAPYGGPLASVFGFVPLPARILAAVLLILTAYLAAVEAAKRLFYA